jgi:hypothetical protein
LRQLDASNSVEGSAFHSFFQMRTGIGKLKKQVNNAGIEHKVSFVVFPQRAEAG